VHSVVVDFFSILKKITKKCVGSVIENVLKNVLDLLDWAA
jgi:hypothetical protein